MTARCENDIIIMLRAFACGWQRVKHGAVAPAEFLQRQVVPMSTFEKIYLLLTGIGLLIELWSIHKKK